MGYAAYASAIPRSCSRARALPNLHTTANAIGGWLSAPVCIHRVPAFSRMMLTSKGGPTSSLTVIYHRTRSQGHCTRPHCFYKHTSNPPKKEVAATCTANSKRKEKAAKAAARNAEQAQVAAQQTLDLAELKNILPSLLTEGDNKRLY